MTRLSLVLLVMLMLSSLYLVHVSYESRTLYTELDRARNEEKQLSNEEEKLKSERQSQATPLRIEKTARDKLGMRMATPAVTQYVSWQTAAASGDLKTGAEANKAASTSKSTTASGDSSEATQSPAATSATAVPAMAASMGTSAPSNATSKAVRP